MLFLSDASLNFSFSIVRVLTYNPFSLTSILRVLLSASSYVRRLVIEERRSPSFEMARVLLLEPLGVGKPKPFLLDGDSTMFLESMFERSGLAFKLDTL